MPVETEEIVDLTESRTETVISHQRKLTTIKTIERKDPVTPATARTPAQHDPPRSMPPRLGTALISIVALAEAVYALRASAMAMQWWGLWSVGTGDNAGHWTPRRRRPQCGECARPRLGPYPGATGRLPQAECADAVGICVCGPAPGPATKCYSDSMIGYNLCVRYLIVPYLIVSFI
jgi:hypothetical protein